MEYAEEGDLDSAYNKQKHKEKKNFTEEKILDWLIQALFGLKYLHSQNIVHRDIKPTNLFLNKNQILKIGDFGFSKFFKGFFESKATICGTLPYFAPELFENKGYTNKIDIWSLGVSFYEVMTFEVPFNKKISFSELKIKVQNGEYKKIDENLYSKELRDIIYCMLTTNYEERPSAVDLLRKPLLTRRMANYLIENNYNNLFSTTLINMYIDQKIKENCNDKNKNGEESNYELTLSNNTCNRLDKKSILLLNVIRLMTI